MQIAEICLCANYPCSVRDLGWQVNFLSLPWYMMAGSFAAWGCHSSSPVFTARHPADPLPHDVVPVEN